MKHILSHLIITTLLLTACGVNAPAAVEESIENEQPVIEALPSATLAISTTTSSPIPSPTLTPVIQYRVIIGNTNVQPVSAFAGGQVQIDYPEGLHSILICVDNPANLDCLVLANLEGAKFIQPAEQINYEGQVCAQFAENAFNLNPNGFIQVGRLIENKFTHFFDLSLNYISSSKPSGNAGNSGGHSCPPGTVWFPEYKKCCDAIAGCTGE